jgi:crotonobetaine/carnitine-CoA ligase
MILKGGTLIIPDRFHPSTFWQDIATTGATLFHYLGIVPPVLLKQAPVPDERQHRLKFGYGAGINPVDHRAFEQRFNVPLCEGWGMVEMAICAVDNYEPRKLDTRSFGQPLTGVEFRIVDGNDQEVSVGTEGELTVRRAGTDSRLGFFSGYFNNAEATAEAWRGGWFHTGDMVRRDESGTYYFVDRIKNIIRRSAQNIAAVEIEAMLQAHEAIAEVAVIAAPDEIREEEVFACIVLNPDYKPVRETAEAIIAWSQTQMSYFKVPGWLLFMERLPLTSTQKMQKARIFSPGEDPRQAPGAMDFRDRKQRR